MPTEEVQVPDLNTLIPQLMESLQAITQKVDEIATRQDELDSVLYDGLIGPANEAIAQKEYDDALSDFRMKYAEKLDPFVDVAKAIEGDDTFDVYKEAFDTYNDNDYGVSPEEYVDQLAQSLTDQISHIKEVVAEVADVSPEQVAVEVSAEDGEVTVDVDDTTTEEQPEDHTTEETVPEESTPTTDETDATEESTPTEEVSDGEESLEDFEKSLREELEKDPAKIKY